MKGSGCGGCTEQLLGEWTSKILRHAEKVVLTIAGNYCGDDSRVQRIFETMMQEKWEDIVGIMLYTSPPLT